MLDCEYILVCKIGHRKAEHDIHATTLVDAEEQARNIVREHQEESLSEFPFSPYIVEGVLFQPVKEFSGQVFVRKEPQSS